MENAANRNLSDKSIKLKYRESLFLWKEIPLYGFLLPLFFVFHGYSEYLFYIPETEAFSLLIVYLLITIVLIVLFYSIYRNINKATIAGFISLFLYFFFGPFHDTLKKVADHTFLVKYSFLLPALVVFYIFSLLLVKRLSFGRRITKFLNTLFFLLILYDLAIITIKVFSEKSHHVPVSSANYVKPDVYLVILDGYAGQEQLLADFSFDNRGFLDSLRGFGFYVLDSSKSNYSDTPFSVSSLLNFEYLDLKDFSYSDRNLNSCYKWISKNAVVKVFQDQGYEFVNNSIFDIGNKASLIEKTFLISGIDLISSQTLISRIKRDLYNNFLMRHMRQSRLYKDIVFRDYRNNEKLYNKLLSDSKKQTSKPRFIYTHLMMPHFPYYYNAKGDLNKLNDLRFDQLGRKDLYLGYLQYCNHKVLSLVAEILENSKKATTILLLSDHGYRYESTKHLRFSNLAAIHLPDKDYSIYHNNLSNVNQFRVLFRKLFEYTLPVLNDSTVQ